METEEEIEEVAEKPRSMLSEKTKRALSEAIDKLLREALNRGEHAYAIELQRAKKLIEHGCWSIRKDNPYLYFMSECLAGKGGTLEQTQKAMKECALKWRQLPPEKRKEYEVKAKGLAVYDYS